MKFRLLVIVICVCLFMLPYLIYQKYVQAPTAPDVVPELFQNVPYIQMVAFEDTARMADAFKTADQPIYISRFPDDFADKGTPDLFIQALLPYIQFYNQQIIAERQQFVAIANKLWSGQPLTETEIQRFMQLAELYDVQGDIDAGTAYHLLEKINFIPQTVALSVALRETQDGTKNLSSPFSVYVWNADNHYVRAAYPDLDRAYYAWMYQLNTADAHARFRELRQRRLSARSYPRAGYFLLKALQSLQPHVVYYENALSETYKKHNLVRFEDIDE